MSYGAFELGDDAFRQRFPQLNAPLIEGVDVPDDTLGEDTVFVEGDQFAERSGVSRSARIVFDGRLPSKTRCGTRPVGVPSALTSSGRLSQSQRLGLGKHVGDAVSRDGGPGASARCKSDKVARNELGSLMYQLVEGMLPVGARLAPEDRAGVVVDRRSIERDALAVAFHGNCWR